MKNKYIIAILCCVLLVTSGCQTGPNGDDYSDAPKEIQDGSLDYQDYKEAECPYLKGSLDQETMEKCNEWIRENPEKVQS